MAEEVKTDAGVKADTTPTPAEDNKGVADDTDLLGDVANEEKPAADGTTPAEDDSDDLLEGKVKTEDKPESDIEDDYEFKIPEGYEANAELAASFKPVAKELGLTKEQASGLVEKFAPQMLTQMGEKQAQQWKAVQTAWANEAKNDPEFGGKNLEASLSDVARARDFAGAEFTKAVKLLGGNNNPAILKFLAKVGKALGEDSPGFGTPASAKKTPEQKLYPNDQPNK